MAGCNSLPSAPIIWPLVLTRVSGDCCVCSCLVGASRTVASRMLMVLPSVRKDALRPTLSFNHERRPQPHVPQLALHTDRASWCSMVAPRVYHRLKRAKSRRSYRPLPARALFTGGSLFVSSCYGPEAVRSCLMPPPGALLAGWLLVHRLLQQVTGRQVLQSKQREQRAPARNYWPDAQTPWTTLAARLAYLDAHTLSALLPE